MEVDFVRDPLGDGDNAKHLFCGGSGSRFWQPVVAENERARGGCGDGRDGVRRMLGHPGVQSVTHLPPRRKMLFSLVSVVNIEFFSKLKILVVHVGVS